jgi:hypothetical protein
MLYTTSSMLVTIILSLLMIWVIINNLILYSYIFVSLYHTAFVFIQFCCRLLNSFIVSIFKLIIPNIFLK